MATIKVIPPKGSMVHPKALEPIRGIISTRGTMKVQLLRQGDESPSTETLDFIDFVSYGDRVHRLFKVDGRYVILNQLFGVCGVGIEYKVTDDE